MPVMFRFHSQKRLEPAQYLMFWLAIVSATGELRSYAEQLRNDAAGEYAYNRRCGAKVRTSAQSCVTSSDTRQTLPTALGFSTRLHANES